MLHEPGIMGGATAGALLRMVVAVSFVVALSGCSTLSDSLSDSVSRSVSSPFKWSSGSSSGSSGEKQETYQGDVRRYTEVAVRSNSGVGEVMRGLTAIGEKHGITNWEADMATYAGIGEGLAKAQAIQPTVDVYKSGLTQGDTDKSAAIQKGYDNGR